MAHLPFVGKLCSSFAINDREMLRFIEMIARSVLEDSVTSLLADASGAIDYALLAAEAEFALAARAATASPPITPVGVCPSSGAHYTTYQHAALALRQLLRNSEPSSLPSTSSHTVTPPPTPPATPRGPGSTINKSCPVETRGAAAAVAITLDKVACSEALMHGLRALEEAGRTQGFEEFTSKLASVEPDVRALVYSSFDHIDVAAFAHEAALLARSVARFATKGAKASLRASELLLVDANTAPNIQLDIMLRHITDGALHLITEFHLTGSPNANKTKLFSGGATPYEFMIMHERVRIVLEAFAKAHPSQASHVDAFLLCFRSLAKVASDAGMPVSLVLDFVWLPFFKEFHQACTDAKESSSREFPVLDTSLLAPHMPIAQRLQNAYLSSLRAHFSSSAPRPRYRVASLRDCPSSTDYFRRRRPV